MSGPASKGIEGTLDGRRLASAGGRSLFLFLGKADGAGGSPFAECEHNRSRRWQLTRSRRARRAAKRSFFQRSNKYRKEREGGEPAMINDDKQDAMPMALDDLSAPAARPRFRTRGGTRKWSAWKSSRQWPGGIAKVWPGNRAPGEPAT